MKHIRNTIWEKIDYLKSMFPGFSLRHIRYCAFSSLHLIVNDNQKWAYIVHDAGTIVSSEMAVEEVDYQRAIDKFEDVLAEIDIEHKPIESRYNQKVTPENQSNDESFYEFIQAIKHKGPYVLKLSTI